MCYIFSFFQKSVFESGLEGSSCNLPAMSTHANLGSTSAPRASSVIAAQRAATEKKGFFDIPMEVLVELWPCDRLHSGLLTCKKLYDGLPKRDGVWVICSRVFSRTFRDVNTFLEGGNGGSKGDVPK